MKKGLLRGPIVQGLTLVLLLTLAACSSGGEGDVSNSPSGDVPLLMVNPYKNECVVGEQYQMCYVTSVGDTGDFSAYSGEISNFDYEWGYGYEISGSFDGNAFIVDEILTKEAETGGIKFSMTITGGEGHIDQISDGLFEMYGQKRFSCSADVDCDSLSQAIDQDQKFTFEFETADNPADPYQLLAWEEG